MSEKVPSDRGGRYAKTNFGPEHRAAARAIFESKPGVTCNEIAREIGVHPGTVRKWKSDSDKACHPWRAARHMPPTLAGRAGELANTFKVKMSELGSEIGPDGEHVAAKEVGELAAIEVRAKIIDTHRREWMLPRRLIYEASRDGNMDKARLALVAAETLEIIQKNERRAFGISAEALAPEPVIVDITRED